LDPTSKRAKGQHFCHLPKVAKVLPLEVFGSKWQKFCPFAKQALNPAVMRRAGGRFRAREAQTGGANGYFFGAGGAGFSRVLEEAPAPAVDAPATAGREAPPAAAAVAARITPAVLFVTVVLAVVLLVSGLLHVLRRLFLKTYRRARQAPKTARSRKRDPPT
jgi:hypothetical protein